MVKNLHLIFVSSFEVESFLINKKTHHRINSMMGGENYYKRCICSEFTNLSIHFPPLPPLISGIKILRQ